MGSALVPGRSRLNHRAHLGQLQSPKLSHHVLLFSVLQKGTLHQTANYDHWCLKQQKFIFSFLHSQVVLLTSMTI